MASSSATDTAKQAAQAAAETAKQGISYVAESLDALTGSNSNDDSYSSISAPKPTSYAEVQAAGMPVSTPNLNDPSAYSVHREGTDYISEIAAQKQQGLDPAQQGVSNTANISGRPTERNVPLSTVESSAEPDVTYEHRPKTLPQIEVVEREKQRGLRGAATGVPSKVVASEVISGQTVEAAKSAEAMHEKDAVERELLSKVKPAQPAVEAQAGVRSGPATGQGVAPAPGSVPPASGATETAMKKTETLQRDDAKFVGQRTGDASSVDPSHPRSGSLANHSLDAVLPPTAVERGVQQYPPTSQAKRSGSGATTEDAAHPHEHARQDSDTLPQNHLEQSVTRESGTQDPARAYESKEQPPKQSTGKPGKQENPDAIPIAGGQKVGEQHFGESKTLE